MLGPKMSSENLKTSIHNHFRFLLNDYGFAIITERYNQSMGNAVIEFSKVQTLIVVVKDRGQILIELGDHRLERRESVEFAEAVRFLSGDPSPVYSFPAEYNDQTEESQVSHLAEIMQQYCVPILSGTMTVIQLRDAIRSQREKETREFLDGLRGKSNLEKTD